MMDRNELYQHLVDRGMDPDRYRVSFGDDGTVSFFLYNLSGQLAGFQRYNPETDAKKKRNDEHGRYFTHATKTKTADGQASLDVVFGLEAIQPPIRITNKPLYVVEGVFKAGVLHRLGYDAIAVLTSHPKRLKTWFRIIKELRPVIGIGDDDAGGRKLVRFVGAGFTSPLDLDEMSDEQVHALIQQNVN